MDWTNESILRFMRLYKMHPCIWNTKHKNHRNRNIVNDAWVDIQQNMPIPYSIPQMKKKKESLMSAYRAYKTKIKNSKSVNGVAVYRPSWFAFATMDSFLASVYLCNKNRSENDLNATDPKPTTSNDPDTNPSDTEDHDADPETTSADKRSPSPLDCPISPKKPKKPRYREFYSHPAYRNFGNNLRVEEDECDIVSKLWARKLRKLPEDRRDLLIYKINTLMYKECVDSYRGSTPSPNMIIPSPVQIFREDDSDMSDSNSCNENKMDESTRFSGDNKEFINQNLYEGEANVFKPIKLYKRQ